MRLRSRNRVGFLLTFPLTVGFLLFYVYPFLLVFLQSVSAGTRGNRIFIGLSNLKATALCSSFQLALGNTLKFLAVCLPMIMVISYAIALLLYFAIREDSILKSVLFLPYIMPVVGSVLIVDLLLTRNGVIDHIFHVLGFTVRDWMNSASAFWAIVVLYLWKNTGYTTILLLAGLNTIPKELYEAAELDGAGVSQKLRFITMPQMWYSLYYAMIFSLINSFKCFREIFLIGGIHPDSSIYLLQHFINNVFEKMDYSKLCAASIIFFLMIVVPFMTTYRFVIRKEQAAN